VKFTGFAVVTRNRSELRISRIVKVNNGEFIEKTDIFGVMMK